MQNEINKKSEVIFYALLVLYLFQLVRSRFFGVDIPLYLANLLILAVIAKAGIKNNFIKEYYSFLASMLFIHMLSLNDMGNGSILKIDRNICRILIVAVGALDFLIELKNKRFLLVILIIFWSWISWLWLPTAAVIMLQIVVPTAIISILGIMLTIKYMRKN